MESGCGLIVLYKNPSVRSTSTLSTEHALEEQCTVSPLRWTVRNKIRQFAVSAGQLMSLKGLGARAETEKRPHDRKMTFSLYAPEAGCVSLAGDFNSWNLDVHPLEKASDGLWERVVCLPPGRYEYKFVVDGQWHNDPRCTVYTPNPFGGENCVVILS